ncbi:MAG: ATP-dependent DNA ligase, partial [Chitinophagaceae bacterium]
KLQMITFFFCLFNYEKFFFVTLQLFFNKKKKRLVSSTLLQTWCAELANIPLWLFQECYHTVGDLAETVALLIPAKESKLEWHLHECIEQLLALQSKGETAKKEWILYCWQNLGSQQLFAFNKLLTGGFRIGVSDKLIFQALAQYANTNAAQIAHALSGNWQPQQTSLQSLLQNGESQFSSSKPYPFYLCYPFHEEFDKMDDISNWQIEWKWDGIRVQLVKRNSELHVWSRGEELITQQFPELQVLLPLLPDGLVLDGELIIYEWLGDSFKPQPFQQLQTRIARKALTKKILTSTPAAIIVYDVLEYAYNDFRAVPLYERRKKAEDIVANAKQLLPMAPVFISPLVQVPSWQEAIKQRLNARKVLAEGLMLKHKNAIYQTGRKSGDWWKWKINPFTIDAVLIYAQKGHGRRSNLYTDYTFAVKNEANQLVSFTKAYSGLTDKELQEVDAFVKKNAIEKFGPVRTVKPELVFEIAFEGIAASNRHKSGVALRFPRISRWRKDKTVDEINTLQDLKTLLQQVGS